MHDALLTYIKESKAAQIPNRQIIASLIEAGWDMSEVVNALINHVHESPLKISSEIKAPSAISIQNLSKAFNGLTALDLINLEVPANKVLALLGPNGAGKTTLVRILATLLTPSFGKAEVFGKDVVANPQEVRKMIGLTGQFAAVDGILTGRENLELVGSLYHLSPKESKLRAEELLRDFDLTEAADRLAKTYSGGMRRRLDLAASLVGNPKVLFLDEPTTGLDPRGRNNLWEIIKRLAADGTTILLTTQYLEEADHLADKVVVIDHGRIIAEGTSKELKAQVGGDVLEIHLANHTEAEKAAQAVSALGQEKPHIDFNSGKITLPVQGGATVLAQAIRALDSLRVELSDIALRRPTLDDVFMKLTGHITEN